MYFIQEKILRFECETFDNFSESSQSFFYGVDRKEDPRTLLAGKLLESQIGDIQGPCKAVSKNEMESERGMYPMLDSFLCVQGNIPIQIFSRPVDLCEFDTSLVYKS